MTDIRLLGDPAARPYPVGFSFADDLPLGLFQRASEVARDANLDLARR
jgi:hypothetical protein